MNGLPNGLSLATSDSLENIIQQTRTPEKGCGYDITRLLAHASTYSRLLMTCGHHVIPVDDVRSNVPEVLACATLRMAEEQSNVEQHLEETEIEQSEE
jgi:hypothetical protein